MGNTPVREVSQFRFPSGNVYSGQMRGTKRHGQGTLKWPDGATYTGQWVNDLCEGQGTMRFPNGSVYEGNFVQNNPYGQGTLTTINQEALSGFWEYHGRSGMTATPAGMYIFDGQLIDLKTKTVRVLHRQNMAFYLLSGLVSLPNMPDPMMAMLPFAEVVADDYSAPQGKKDKYDEKESVPVAQAVQSAPPSSSSIVFGKPDVALMQRHPDDHFAVDVADPRLYLGSLGLPVYAPNVNASRQAQLQANYPPQQHF